MFAVKNTYGSFHVTVTIRDFTHHKITEFATFDEALAASKRLNATEPLPIWFVTRFNHSDFPSRLIGNTVTNHPVRPS